MVIHIDSVRASLIDAIGDEIRSVLCDMTMVELEKIYNEFIINETSNIKINRRKPFKLLDCTNFSDCESEDDCVECTTKLMIRFNENDYYWNEK